MDSTTYVSEPASELERLITDLSGSGLLVFVFGDGFTTAHLNSSETLPAGTHRGLLRNL